MKTVTMLEFRKDAEGILRRIAKGERLLLSHRGRPAARLEPLLPESSINPTHDPFLNVGDRSLPSPKGKTHHRDIDRLLYGRPALIEPRISNRPVSKLCSRSESQSPRARLSWGSFQPKLTHGIAVSASES